MDYKYLSEKNRIFIACAELYIEVQKRGGNVSKEFTSKLAAYKLPLSLMVGDECVGIIAEYTLAAINSALLYIETKQETDLLQMAVEHKKADAILNKIYAELLLDGVKNGY